MCTDLTPHLFDVRTTFQPKPIACFMHVQVFKRFMLELNIYAGIEFDSHTISQAKGFKSTSFHTHERDLVSLSCEDESHKSLRICQCTSTMYGAPSTVNASTCTTERNNHTIYYNSFTFSIETNLQVLYFFHARMEQGSGPPTPWKVTPSPDAIIDPPAKRHWNGVSLAGQRWPA